MSVQNIPFQQTTYFSSLVCDYLATDEKLAPYYNRFPEIDNFEAQIQEKQLSIKPQSRKVLVQALKNQYSTINTSKSTQNNIALLAQNNTFTITTGHQLNLFTGPLYFLYKIISTLNLCDELRIKYPKQNFVPIYWMATEDHDFLEINHFNFKGNKVEWKRNDGGAVGEFSTDGLQEVFEGFSKQLGLGINADGLRTLFKNSYLKHDNLADATRYLANELFGEYGLVIVDANDKSLKKLFIPYVKQELLQQTTFKKVTETITNFPHKVQVNPRKINLFYIKEGLRERIIFENNSYKVNNTDIKWTENEILKHLNEMPERFSPNVLLRPLLQEILLPNLCYIGGGGELAYWMELKTSFTAFNVVFPMLLLRNSVLIITEKQQQKISKLKLKVADLFLSQTDLLAQQTKQLSTLKIDFSTQKETLKQQFTALYKIAKETDDSFVGAVAAQEKKQLKGLDNLEKRLLTAEKRKHSEFLSRIIQLQNELFPKQSLQERKQNFSELYLEYGAGLIPKLKSTLEPLNGEFLVVS